MPEWVRHKFSAALSTEGSHSNSEIVQLHNQTDNLFEDSDLFIVDGLVGIISDIDDLVAVRLVVPPETVTDAQLSDVNPEENSPMIKYSWWAGRGFVLYRIASTIRIPPQFKAWLTLWKESGSTSSIIRVGARLFVHKK